MRNKLTVMLSVLVLGVMGLVVIANAADEPAKPGDASALAETRDPIPDDAAVATLAGGCFWCTEAAYQEMDGVYEVISGYTGGPEVDPTYKQVASGQTGHAEAVEIYFDPTVVSYDELLDLYWRLIDPTDAGGQFVDRGPQYRAVVFYHDEEQRALAEASREALAASGRFDAPIVTQIEPAMPFYPAEEYHQDFYLKAPERYEPYKRGSGRDPYVEEYWGDETGEPEATTE
jgi:methionine-S-sulfoxide reductase